MSEKDKLEDIKIMCKLKPEEECQNCHFCDDLGEASEKSESQQVFDEFGNEVPYEYEDGLSDEADDEVPYESDEEEYDFNE